ncbi:hypothetical protein [Halospeciosus flavus]|uniref:Uncharacterized protein n=1 Tax=Halospeciosus flavus TaxID=3032283 RepID=A0ABD5Z676_9EURY|nr:hypothetical protein [Halospeciosus flavus]
MTTYDGTEVDVEHVKPLSNGGARFDVEHPDGRRWQLDVSRTGESEIVTSWRDGQLVDLDIPDWLDDLLAQLARRS